MTLRAQLKAEAAAKRSDDNRRFIAEAARAELMRRSLYRFMKGGWHVLEGGRFEDNWHIKAICDETQALLEGWIVAQGPKRDATEEDMVRYLRMRQAVVLNFLRHGIPYTEELDEDGKIIGGEMLVQNQVFNLPPISLKSRIIMVFACAWLWLYVPHAKIGALSGIDINVKRDSDAHRKLVSSAWYRKTFLVEWKVDPHSAAVSEWSTVGTAKNDNGEEIQIGGGQRISRTILMGLTGAHVDIILIDDPDDAHKVWNESHRTMIQDRYSKAIENRVNNERKCLRVVVQQRVHALDFTHYLLGLKRWGAANDNRLGWAWFVMPMQFGKGPDDAPRMSVFGFVDPRTVEGDLIQPSRFGEAQLADKRTSMTDYGVEAQYNQNPDVITDGLIKPDVIRFWRAEGSDDKPHPRPLGCDQITSAFQLGYRASGEFDVEWMTLTVDCSFGSLTQTASAVALTTVMGRGWRRFVLDDRTKPRTFDATKKEIRELIGTYRITKLLIEDKANGPDVISDLERELAEGVITEMPNGELKRVPIKWPGGDRALVKVEKVSVPGGAGNKIARAMTMVPEFNVGMIYLLDGAVWSTKWVGEICTFPKSKRNDRVDAMSQLQTHYRDKDVGLTKAIAQARW